MVRNSLFSSLVAVAFLGVAACGQDQSELPADDFPAAEAPAVAPEADAVEPFEQNALEDTVIVEEETEMEAEAPEATTN